MAATGRERRKRALKRASFAAMTGSRGLECPDCGCRHFDVVRTIPGMRHIRRVRSCRYCGRRVTTSERVDGPELD
jgi:hypothetical protein